MEANNSQNKQGMNFLEPEGFIKLWVFILLYVVTFGIYLYFWIYKTVGLLNKKTGDQDGQVPQLLLCIFVPFYMLYWLYKYSNKLVVYCNNIGFRINNISVTCMVLAVCGMASNVLWLIFLYFPIFWVFSIVGYVCTIIAYALMQNTINGFLIYEVNQNFDTAPYAYTEMPKERVYSEDTAKNVIDKPIRMMGTNENSNDNTVSQLRELKSLFDMGILTEEEFNFKKQQLLK